MLRSHFFIRLAIGSGTEKEALWKFLLNSTELAGDPIAWKFVVDSSKWDQSAITIRYNKEIATISRMEAFNNLGQESSNYPNGIDLWHQEGDLFHLRVRKIFFRYTYFVQFIPRVDSSGHMTISYLIRKSDAFKRQPHSRIEWRMESKGESTVEITVETRGEDTDNHHSSVLLNLLESVASSIDLTEMRADQKRTKQIEIQKLRELEKLEKERLEQEKILAARRVASQRAQEETGGLTKDRCHSCGASCVQRRRKSDGHLFFGCSKYFTTICKGARSIPCPKCGLEMIERRHKEGGTFLGCTGWPSCDGSRTIDTRLASERGVGTRSADARKSYLSKKVHKVEDDVDDDEAWWEEWGDRVHSDDPRETPQYYDHRLLDRWREDPDVP